MSTKAQYLISKDDGNLQIPYAEYEKLMERMKAAKRIMKIKAAVLADLQSFLERQGGVQKKAPETVQPTKAPAAKPSAPAPAAPAEKISKEISSADSGVQSQGTGSSRPANVEIPPIKKEIAAHFNAQDESGRLFNVFKQYYTCLNDACGGTVRVTMKDGVCSLWNYDEWEEFAFVDIFDANLRFALDPRYTDELSSLSFCEVPRLLSSRRNLVSVQLGDLNKTMLKVLIKAFNEVGLLAS